MIIRYDGGTYPPSAQRLVLPASGPLTGQSRNNAAIGRGSSPLRPPPTLAHERRGSRESAARRARRPYGRQIPERLCWAAITDETDCQWTQSE